VRGRTAVALVALILLFIALGWPFVTRLGIEVDEALVGNGIYDRGAPWYSWRIGDYEIPVMLLTYLGALKTWFYNGIFAVWDPGPVSLRLPTLLLGGFTLVLFFRLCDRALGRSAAWFGTAMLAVDPTFVLLSAVDYGPVAIQHALKLGAILLVITFHRTGEVWRLAGAAFLLGLAMWDKAIFSWFLIALVVSGVAVFGKELRAHLSLRNAAAAVAGFVTGAFPWIVYNVARPLETYTDTARLSVEGAWIKLILLKRTLDGSGLFGFMTAPDAGPMPGFPRSAVQHLQFGIADVLQHPVASLTGVALVVAIVLLPLVRSGSHRRSLVFAVLLMGMTWVQMFFTKGAGGAVHHVALIAPFHILVIAGVVTALARERVAIAVAAVLCLSQLLVLNTYHVALIRNGGSVRWTDAFTPLHRFLRETPAEAIVTADWGILETLNLMSQGELPVVDASTLLYPQPQPAALIPRLRAAGAIWVAHSAGREQWEGVNAALDDAAAQADVSKEIVSTIYDRNGRAIFDILAFRTR
jgi:hypothetical protein